MNELVIRSGGAVEVDTASLRAVAVDLDTVAREVDDIRADVETATAHLHEVGPEAGPLQWLVAALLAGARRAGRDAADLAERVRAAADRYEAVELLVERELAAAAGDAAAVRRLDHEIHALPVAAVEAARRSVHSAPLLADLENQALLTSIILGTPASAAAPMLVRALGGLVHGAGRGRVGADRRLEGRAIPVEVRRLPSASARASPATSFADAAARIPGGGDARVRVERYAMPSGAAQYAVYIAGTQSFGGPDAFDTRSNLELYGGRRSASYDAVLAALEDAGARPGDRVHAFGHSQGAMVGERLAVESPYRVETLGSFGSPVQADASDETLAVSVRHTDDPVAALQGGGHPHSVGAPGSFVVERLADPLPGIGDLALPAHHMDGYVETARLIDGSDDPRVGALRAVFEELGHAESVETREYSAVRVSPSTAGAG